MSLDQALLHLCFHCLKAGTLTLVNALVGYLHFARAKLFYRVRMMVGVLDALVDILEIGLGCEGSGALDPLGRSHGTLL